jgi:peptide/nickel transport system permease protein
MYAQIHTEPPSPRSYRADLSAGVERVLVRQLGKDPSQRYPTGRAFVEALDEAVQRARWVAESQDGNPFAGGASVASPLPSRGPVGPGTVGQDAARQGRSRTDATTAGGATAGGRRAGVAASGQTRSGPDSGSVSIPAPPSPSTDPGARAAITGTIDAPPEIPFGLPTLLKLVFGVTMLILLLMTFLPMPHDPGATNYSERLQAPRGLAGSSMLGTDGEGRDILSRMSAGGRFIVLRAAIIGLLVTAAGLAIRRRARRRGRQPWLTAPRLIMTVAIVLSASMLLELVIGLLGGVGPFTLRRLQVSGIVGRIFLGVPPTPSSTPSWGGMLANGIDLGMQALWLIVFPGLALLMVVVGFPLLGSGIVDLLRLRQSVERRRQSSDTAILS